MSFRLPTTEEKAIYVQDQFERIARRYDLTNDVISLGMHRFWKERAVDGLSLVPEGRYLDVCCGTGDLALSVARRLSSRGQVTGVDFSRNMLAVAGRRAGLAGERALVKARLVWLEADAENLPFDDGSFDGAIISFGLRNLTNMQKGLSEMARVVRPGGRVVNLDVGKPTLPVFAPLFHLYFRQVVPIIGEILQSDRQAYTYLPESAQAYPPPEEISAIFRSAGLSKVVHQALALGSVALHSGTVT